MKTYTTEKHKNIIKNHEKIIKIEIIKNHEKSRLPTVTIL
jgi:hypothetical protein